MPTDRDEAQGWALLRSLPRESPARALIVTLLVCAVCSAAIAVAVNVLRPYQEVHREAQREARVLEIVAAVPGLEDLLGPLATARVEARVVELASGRWASGIDPASFDARSAERDAQTSTALPPERDLAGIGRRANFARVFLVLEGEVLRLLVLPVHGAGYVSTLHGYLALDPDLDTVRGLSFYEHSETPGLGSEIENPRWQQQWVGKRLRDETGALRIGVARGTAARQGPDAPYLVDGISGATRTGTGVTRLLHFWLGPDGFSPLLDRLASEGGGP